MDKGEAEVRLAEVEDWLERKEYAERLRRRRLFPLIGAGLLIVVALVVTTGPVALVVVGGVTPFGVGLGALLLLQGALGLRRGRRSALARKELEAERETLRGYLSAPDNAALPLGSSDTLR